MSCIAKLALCRSPEVSRFTVAIFHKSAPRIRRDGQQHLGYQLVCDDRIPAHRFDNVVSGLVYRREVLRRGYPGYPALLFGVLDALLGQLARELLKTIKPIVRYAPSAIQTFR